MGAENDVAQAAEARAAALATGDADALMSLLHEDFRWTTHTGQVLDRREYVRRNTGGDTTWQSQVLLGPHVAVVGATAVLHAEVTDVVLAPDGEPEAFHMPMTHVWVREGARWSCLAGHAGPRRDG